MKTIRIKPVKKLSGEISVQGDKSISHRAIIFGSIANGVTKVTNFLTSDDCIRTMRAFEAMGVKIDAEGDAVEIHGNGPAGLIEPADVMDMGNSGTSARLLTGLLSGQPFFSLFTGDNSLRRRPMKRVIGPLKMMGANIWGRKGGEYLPLAIRGGKLQGISYTLPVPSAQVKSAILLAGLFAEGQTSVVEGIPSRDHTELMMESFGINLMKDGATIMIDGGQVPYSNDITVPGDISAAAFFLVGASILEGSDVVIKDVGINPTRTGIVDILKEMGASIEIYNQREFGKEPVADLRVRSAALHGIEIKGEIIPRCVDELPVITIAAAMADGETFIRDAAELRYKESDRITVMADCLTALGVDVETYDDGMWIKGSRKLIGTQCTSLGDHRIAMSMAIAGLSAEGETVIEDTECINTSFPKFEETLKTLCRDN
ncbi:MAG: 3-phosphoshikimate 1-carboxyvinyltransferase [Nitrospirae bacterium]|nr:3-phosphoshikimate 1-carboxyvinyltransferase [Nitrospirota bacterium]